MYDINNPAIPFEAPLPGGFRPNSEVIIHGRSMKGKNGVFVVEFGAGNDVALHMSFRYKSEHKLVINTSSMGNWQTEERHPNPVFQDHSFVLQVQCKPGEYIIWQKHHKMTFKHRMDPSLITSLRINGEVSVEKINFEGFQQGSANPYVNAPHPSAPPSYPSPSQYPQPGGGNFGAPGSGYHPNIGSGTHGGPPPYYGGPTPTIGGGTQMRSYGAPQPGIGFGTNSSPAPNIGYGSTPGPNAGGYQGYPSLNNANPAPNSQAPGGGYPQMNPYHPL